MKAWLTSVVCCLLLVGCPSSSSPTDSEPVPIAEYGAATARLACGAWFECCTDAERMSVIMSPAAEADVDDCIAYYTSLYSAGTVAFEESIAAGRLAYDAELAGDCFARSEALTCDEIRMLDFTMAGEDCAGVFVAHVGPDGACSSALDCTTQYCQLTPGSSMGTCVTLPAVGEACPGGICARRAYCRMGTCAAQGATGDACASGPECQSFRCEMGVCAAPAVALCGT